MIIVSKSTVVCGVCGAKSVIEWDLDIIDSYKKNMGINSEYLSEITIECEKCGNMISTRLRATEYPEGVLENLRQKL